MIRQSLACIAATLVLCGSANAGVIGIGGFSGGETVTTFNTLGLDFTTAAPLVFNGNTYTTDDGSIRYTDPNSFAANCNDECIGNNSDNGFINIVLGTAQNRVGALVGGSNATFAGFVDFFDAADNLLGSVAYGNSPGMVFVGWEDLGTGIGRMRLRDTATNGLIVHMDDFRFESVSVVPVPGTLATVGLGLIGIGLTRRRKV